MKAIVWSKENCNFCEQAKKILISNMIEVEERKIGEGWTKEELLSIVPTARSVPQIFINNEYIGGFTELRNKLS